MQDHISHRPSRQSIVGSMQAPPPPPLPYSRTKKRCGWNHNCRFFWLHAHGYGYNADPRSDYGPARHHGRHRHRRYSHAGKHSLCHVVSITICLRLACLHKRYLFDKNNT